MAGYVLKTFDPSGRLVKALKFEARDDETAAQAVQGLEEDHWCELSGADGRLVRLWDGALLGTGGRRPDPEQSWAAAR